MLTIECTTVNGSRLNINGDGSLLYVCGKGSGLGSESNVFYGYIGDAEFEMPEVGKSFMVRDAQFVGRTGGRLITSTIVDVQVKQIDVPEEQFAPLAVFIVTGAVEEMFSGPITD